MVGSHAIAQFDEHLLKTVNGGVGSHGRRSFGAAFYRDLASWGYDGVTFLC